MRRRGKRRRRRRSRLKRNGKRTRRRRGRYRPHEVLSCTPSLVILLMVAHDPGNGSNRPPPNRPARPSLNQIGAEGSRRVSIYLTTSTTKPSEARAKSFPHSAFLGVSAFFTALYHTIITKPSSHHITPGL